MKSKLLKKIPHPLKNRGFHLEFSNGHKYSVIDLSDPWPPEYEAITDKTERKQYDDLYETIGKTYDIMGGRYEAILLPETNNGVWGDPIRGHSFEQAIQYTEEFEARG